MAKVDPKRSRHFESVKSNLEEHARVFSTYQRQAGSAREEVESWSLEKYLDVMESFVVVNRIQHPEEMWGDLWFKCSCKHCHVHACCPESMLFSMILNKDLKMPPKWGRLEPSDRKRKGRPTEKRVENAMGNACLRAQQ